MAAWAPLTDLALRQCLRQRRIGSGGDGMTQHYYSQTPESESHMRQVEVTARGVTRRLWTDNGVFAKRGLDPGSALLIESVMLPDAGLIVDLGCGYGPVTALLCLVYPTLTYVMLDINERAVDLAKRNTAHAATRVDVMQSDGFSAVPKLRADAILLNPPIRAGKAVVYQLFAQSKAHLRAGGALWVVIHKKHGADSAEKHLMELGADVGRSGRESGYRVLQCTWPE